MKITIEQSIQNRILYIGNKIPECLLEDSRDKFILLGNVMDVINETSNNSIGDRSKFEVACWIAEYAYKISNPKSKFNEPPSFFYEQVAIDFDNFLTNKQHV